MASITASAGPVGKKSDAKNLEEWIILLLNEIRRLRIGDTSPGEGDVL